MTSLDKLFDNFIKVSDKQTKDSMAQSSKEKIDYNAHLYHINAENTIFRDNKTKDKIFTEHESLYVVGNSLDIFGVYDGDVVLVTPVTIGDASKILTSKNDWQTLWVFKIDNELIAYKIWQYRDFSTSTASDERSNISSMVQSDNFKDVKLDIRYTSNSRIISDYINYPGKDMYRGAICTMLNNKNAWILKRVDLQNVVGYIDYVFTPKNKLS